MDGLEFENHIVHNIINDLLSILNEEDSTNQIDLDNLDFFKSAVEYNESRLKISIVKLLNIAVLNNIANDLTNALTFINNFLKTKNQTHLDSVRTHFYNSFSRFNTVPTHITKSSYNFSRSITSFENNLKEKYKILESENEDLNIYSAKLKTEINTLNEKLQILENSLLAKEEIIDDLNSNFKSNFEKIVEDIKEQTEENIEDNNNKIKSSIKILNDEFDNNITSQNEKVKTLIETSEISAQKLINKLEEYKLEGRTLIGLINDSAVTGNYQKIANENKKTANIWRRVSLGFMSLLSCLLIYAIWDISGSDFDWKKSLIRIIVAAALSYPATYAAKESTKHRNVEIRNRKLELELASINPFIDDLGLEEKKKIKEELVNKYFGNNLVELSTDNKDEEISVNIIEKILKSLIPFINK